jgi:hypothetical protein
MNTKNFLEENDAQTEVLGLLLIIGIVTSITVMYLSVQVPISNERAEFEHMTVVYDDMLNLKSDIQNAALYVNEKSSTLHLGAPYPSRLYAGPQMGAAPGTFTVDDNLEITIDYWRPGIYNDTYNSSTLTYTFHGLTDCPQLVYEHGILIEDFGTTQMTNDEQSLIAHDDIYIPIVIAPPGTTSSRGTESLEIHPVARSDIEIDIKKVTITMDTNYPEIWEELLADVNTNDTTVEVKQQGGGYKIVIKSNATEELVLPILEDSYSGIYTGVVQACSWECQERFTLATPAGPGEYYVTKKTPFWINVPPSNRIKQLKITDIVFKKPDKGKIKFEIYDWDEDAVKWSYEIEFDYNPKPNIVIKKITIKCKDLPEYKKDHLALPYDPYDGIDILHLPEQYPSLQEPDKYYEACYPNASVGDVNILRVRDLKDIYFVRFLIS